MADRLERLTNLIAVLLDTRRPLTLEEIVERVPGYPPERESYRRQFERDKATLREIGVPIALEAVHPFDQESGYRIHREDYQLPALDLTDDERVALHLAVTAVRLEGGGEGGGAGREALLKLGGIEGAAAPTLAALPDVPALPFLFDAYRRRARVTFTYRGETRRLDPYGILFRNGHWYGVGFDPDRGAIRAFRAARGLRPRLGAAGRAVALRRRGAGRGPGAGVAGPGRLGGGRSRRPGGGRAARRRVGGRPPGRDQPGGVPVVRARPARPRRGPRPAGAAGRHGGLAQRAGHPGAVGSGVTRTDAAVRLRRLLTVIPWIVDH